MDTLRAMRLFVRLADLGSFTKVADETNHSKSMISKEISKLEQDLGARLLQRSTRNVQLTQVGEEYLARCRQILINIEDAQIYVQDLHDKPKGKLKINAPMALGLTDLSLAFADFMVAYPDIELDIHLGDDPIDLIEQGFDVGFRAASTLFDSNYIGRPLIQFTYHICASESYLASHPPIKAPEDLKQHNCFFYSYFRNKNVWPLGDGVAISGNLKVNNTIFMLDIVKRGLGLGFIPDFVCKDALENREVVDVLADIEKPNLTLYVLYPARQFVPLKLQHCINFLENWFKNRAK
jgi:DNA-binding transcriptional LysR family regulator